MISKSIEIDFISSVIKQLIDQTYSSVRIEASRGAPLATPLEGGDQKFDFPFPAQDTAASKINLET